MAVTRASFQERFPEFKNASPAFLDEILLEAEQRTPVEIWGELRDQGIKMFAAHIAACSPYSRELKLTAKDGTTWYGRERERLEGIVSAGFRVAIDPWLG